MKPVAVNETFLSSCADALSKDQIRFFFDEGYIIIKQLFGVEEISQIKSCSKIALAGARDAAHQYIADNKIEHNTEFRCDYNGPDGPKSASILAVYNKVSPLGIKLISWVGGVQPKLVEFGRQTKITIPVAQLLGSDKADHLINQIHCKIPNDQVAFPWHQDIQNRREFDPEWKDVNDRGSFVQVLTAVDESTISNGPLVFIPKSHRKDLFLKNKQSNEERELIIRKEYDLDKMTVPLLLNPGDTIFMHPLLLHKSNINTSTDGETRELFINGFSSPPANQKQYPGTGSAKTISLHAPSDLITETNEFISEILGNYKDI